MNMDLVENLLSTVGIDSDLIDIIQFSFILIDDEDLMPNGYLLKGNEGETLYALTYGCFYSPLENAIKNPDGDVIIEDISFNTDGMPEKYSIKKMLNAEFDDISQIDALLVSSLVVREYTLEIANYINTSSEDESSELYNNDLLNRLRISRPIDVKEYAQALTEVLDWEISIPTIRENEFPYLNVKLDEEIKGYISPISPSMGDESDALFNEILQELSEYSVNIGEDCLLLCGSGSGVNFDDGASDNFLYPFAVYFDESQQQWSWICFNNISLKDQVGKIPLASDDMFDALESLDKAYYGDSSMMLRYHKIVGQTAEKFFGEILSDITS